MKILCVCEQGNNRSVQFAHLLKYWEHDTLAVGIMTTTPSTMFMLCDWADVIIITEKCQSLPGYEEKTKLFDVGPDVYPRPFNPDLLAKAKKILEENKSWLKK